MKNEMKTEDGFEAVCVDKLSLSFTCRTCLNTDSGQHLTSIFEDTESSVKLAGELFNKLSLLKLQIEKDDGYPPNICRMCVERLMGIDAFQKQCQKAQEYLQQYFVKPPVEASEIKPEVIVCLVEGSEILKDSKDSPPPKLDESFEQNDVGFASEDSSSEYKPDNEEWSSEDDEPLKQPSKDIDKLKCPVCDKIFRTVANKNDHLHLHSDVNAFSCDKCEMSFKSKRYLRKHKALMHSVGDYTCNICGAKFIRTSKYEYHLKTHDTEKKYKCRHCDKSFIQYSQRKSHELTHVDKIERPPSYLCNICGKSFRYECTLRKHILVHEGIRKYSCELCNKTFAYKGNLKLHLDIHKDVRPYQCEQCGKNFRQHATLKAHMMLHMPDKPHRCPFCTESFLRIRELRRHCLMVHAKTDSSLRLDQSLQDNDTAEEPPVKVEEKPPKKGSNFSYSCDLCSKTFKLPSVLAKHIKAHNEERKFHCTQCGNCFKALEHLKNHIKGVHLKQKPHSCKECNKAFTRRGDLNVHMRSHSDEKPHQCSFCGRGFHLAKALRAHTRQHTGERPFVCMICNAGFTCHKTLASHTRRLHAEDPQVLKKVDELAQTMMLAPPSTIAGDEASPTVTKSETH